MLNRIKAIAIKEIRQLKRDSRMLYVLFVFPIILLVIFGYAINFDVHHIKMVIYDQDKSTDSRNFIKSLTSSEYFDLVGYINTSQQIKNVLDTKTAQCVIVFPRDMSEKLYSRQTAKVQILVDGVDANTATIILNYMNIATAAYSQKIQGEMLASVGRSGYIPIDVHPAFWFNPALDSMIFLIPGLIVMILMITAVVSISLSIVREKERGTIEQINVSPLTSLELLIGKTIPYVIISLIIGTFILISGHFLFGTMIKGNIILLFFSTLLFLFAALNLGIIVSSIANTQQVAFQIATLVSMLPSMLLSGFIFPIESMPWVVQILTNITPAKFYLVVLRAILLKGVGIESFWPQLVYLAIFSLVLLFLSSLINKKSKVV
ncbi:MAG: ABC transporter permease [Ignavibacteriaceae bacterium]|nr:ABC transporter permease [Ignavibacteriaceae bacterium]